MLRNECNYKLELNKNTYRAIKILSDTSIDIEKYIKDCIEDYKLFIQEDTMFYSKSLLNRMLEYEKKRKINQENGKLGGRPKNQKKPNGFENETEKNQNKIKESKVKENKINKNNNSKVDDSCVDGLQNVNDSRVDNLQSVISFYESNLGLLTPYGLEVLEDYAKDMSNELLILAMKKAVEADKRTIQYIKGILNNWSRKGIKTILEAEKEDKHFRKTNTKAEEEFLNDES